MKYKVIYNESHTFDETFDTELAARDFAFEQAEDTVMQNLRDIIRSERDDMYEIIEVAE